jgi:predicted dehydrogenase
MTVYHRIPGTSEALVEAAPAIVKEEIPIDKAEPLRVELESFIECVRTRKRPLVSGEEGRDALKVASQIVERL